MNETFPQAHVAFYGHFRGVDDANGEISNPHEEVTFIRLKPEIYYKFVES